jgi:hypothetical protein
LRGCEPEKLAAIGFERENRELTAEESLTATITHKSKNKKVITAAKKSIKLET